ncbi:MAG TPA: methyltransferase domain-containing protein [Vicinamibacterales bacterium]
MTADRASEAKRCCARLYETDFVSLLLGDSYHPGGLALTERLGELLHLNRDDYVVDAASGTGASALHLADRFGCRVSGFDLSQRNVDRANAHAARIGLADRVRFECGDAERLPLADGSVNALVCECAFCTFPDKPQAAREFARVLRGGGRVGLSDITRSDVPSDDLTDLMAWIACLADARSPDTYAAWLAGAGLTVSVIEPHDDALTEMVRSIGVRLMAADVLVALKKIDLPGVDFEAARRMANQARAAIERRHIGYAVICAQAPLRRQ